VIVDERSTGLRLDQVLARLVDGLSRNEAKDLIEKRGVRVAGKPEKSKSRKVVTGDEITVDLSVLDDRSETLRSELKLALQKVAVVAQGPGFVAVDKPSGLPCTPYCLGDTLHLQTAMAVTGLPDNGLVHRLDVGTSGLCLFATDTRAYDTFITARGTTLRRTYRALVDGPMEQSGVISAEIAHHATHADRMVSLPAERFRGEPQRAETRWSFVDAKGDITEVELSITGGRRHQIRVHLASIGRPIRGDALYLSPLHAARFSLHARILHVIDTQGCAHVIVRDAPADFYT